MQVMVTMTFPLKSVKEMGKKTLEALKDPMPDFVRRPTFYLRYGGAGIKEFIVYEVDDDRYAEGLAEVSNRYVSFFDVEGFRVKVDPIVPIEQALAMIGLQM